MPPSVSLRPEEHHLLASDISDGDPGLWAEGTQKHGTTMTDGTECDVADTTVEIEFGDLNGDWDIDILKGARDEQPRIALQALEQRLAGEDRRLPHLAQAAADLAGREGREHAHVVWSRMIRRGE